MTRNRVMVAVAGLVVVAVAFGAGVLVQREYQLAPVRLAEDLARDLAGTDEPVAPAPRWEKWHYPGARSKGSIKGSSLRVMGQLVKAAGRYAVFVTTDDFDTVARWYAEQAGFERAGDVAKSRTGVSSFGRFPEGQEGFLLDDSSDPTGPNAARSVLTKCLMRRSRSYDLTVVLTRGDGEEHTHILLLYDPRTESGREEG